MFQLVFKDASATEKKRLTLHRRKELKFCPKLKL